MCGGRSALPIAVNGESRRTIDVARAAIPEGPRASITTNGRRLLEPRHTAARNFICRRLVLRHWEARAIA